MAHPPENTAVLPPRHPQPPPGTARSQYHNSYSRQQHQGNRHEREHCYRNQQQNSGNHYTYKNNTRSHHRHSSSTSHKYGNASSSSLSFGHHQKSASQRERVYQHLPSHSRSHSLSRSPSNTQLYRKHYRGPHHRHYDSDGIYLKPYHDRGYHHHDFNTHRTSSSLQERHPRHEGEGKTRRVESGNTRYDSVQEDGEISCDKYENGHFCRAEKKESLELEEGEEEETEDGEISNEIEDKNKESGRMSQTGGHACRTKEDRGSYRRVDNQCLHDEGEITIEAREEEKELDWRAQEHKSPCEKSPSFHRYENEQPVPANGTIGSEVWGEDREVDERARKSRRTHCAKEDAGSDRDRERQAPHRSEKTRNKTEDKDKKGDQIARTGKYSHRGRDGTSRYRKGDGTEEDHCGEVNSEIRDEERNLIPRTSRRTCGIKERRGLYSHEDDQGSYLSGGISDETQCEDRERDQVGGRDRHYYRARNATGRYRYRDDEQEYRSGESHETRDEDKDRDRTAHAHRHAYSEKKGTNLHSHRDGRGAYRSREESNETQDEDRKRDRTPEADRHAHDARKGAGSYSRKDDQRPYRNGKVSNEAQDEYKECNRIVRTERHPYNARNATARYRYRSDERDYRSRYETGGWFYKTKEDRGMYRSETERRPRHSGGRWPYSSHSERGTYRAKYGRRSSHFQEEERRRCTDYSQRTRYLEDYRRARHSEDDERSHYSVEREEDEAPRSLSNLESSPSKEDRRALSRSEKRYRRSRFSSLPKTSSPHDLESKEDLDGNASEKQEGNREKASEIPLDSVVRWVEGRSDPRKNPWSPPSSSSSDGRRHTVMIFREFAAVLRPYASDGNDVKSGDERVVLVSGLSDKANETFLIDYMSRFGRVMRVKVGRWSDGRHAGMARIVFEKRAYGLRALQITGRRIMDRPIRVEKDVQQVLMESRLKQAERIKEMNKRKERERREKKEREEKERRRVEKRRAKEQLEKVRKQQENDREAREEKIYVEDERRQLHRGSQSQSSDNPHDESVVVNGKRTSSDLHDVKRQMNREEGGSAAAPKVVTQNGVDRKETESAVKRPRSRPKHRSFPSLKLMMLPSTITYEDLAKAFSYIKTTRWILRQGPYWHILFRRVWERDEAERIVREQHGDFRVNGAKFRITADSITIHEEDLDKQKEEPAKDMADLVARVWVGFEKKVNRLLLTRINLVLNRHAGDVVNDEKQNAIERKKYHAQVKSGSTTVDGVRGCLKMDEEALASLSMFKKSVATETPRGDKVAEPALSITHTDESSGKRLRIDAGPSDGEMSEDDVVRKRRRVIEPKPSSSFSADLEVTESKSRTGVIRRVVTDDSDSEQDEPMHDYDATDWDSPHAKAALAQELCRNLEDESSRESEAELEDSQSPSHDVETDVAVDMHKLSLGEMGEYLVDVEKSDAAFHSVSKGESCLDIDILEESADDAETAFIEEEVDKLDITDPENVTCSRAVVFSKANFDKNRRWMANPGNLVLPLNTDNFVSARESRRETRLFKKGISGFAKSDVLAQSHLNQRTKNVKFSQSKIHGMGLFAQETIEPEEFVIEYMGETIRPTIGDIREQAYIRKGMGDFYLFRVNQSTLIDATRKGCVARFINHSCDPNLYAKKIVVNNQEKIVFYGKRRVSVGEELTYDYKLEYEQEDQKVECLCGSAICQGYLNYRAK